jgi:hypothetical protein
MMLFDPEVGLSIKGGNVTGRQGEGKEIKRDNECISETNKENKFEECHIIPGVRPEKGHLASEVKMANEIVCDHAWDKPYPTFLHPILNGT